MCDYGYKYKYKYKYKIELSRDTMSKSVQWKEWQAKATTTQKNWVLVVLSIGLARLGESSLY